MAATAFEQGRPFLTKLGFVGLRTVSMALRLWDILTTDSIVRLKQDYQNPYPDFLELQRRGAVLRSHANQGWMVTRYAEVTELLREPRLGNNAGDNEFMQNFLRSASGKDSLSFFDYPNLQQVNPPDHTRLRKLVTPGFVKSYIDSLRPFIEQTCDELLATIDTEREFDLVSTLAKPLPARIIAHMLGVPNEDYPKFEKWSADLLGLVDLQNTDAVVNALHATDHLRDYMIDLVSHKRENLSQDFLSTLIEVEEDGDRLTADELYATAILLLVAGHETTTRLIGSTTYLLLANPEAHQQVTEDLGALQRALEESLRLEPPILFLPRLVLEPFDYQGHAFKPGQYVLLSLAAANRDADVFEKPNEFSLDRDAQEKHISFGHGIHLCLGMSLARLEGEIALTKLFEKCPSLTLTRTPRWVENPMFRGLADLPVQSLHA